MRYHERMVMLSVLDGLWKDHLLTMDHLKEGIGLRGYAQQDPLVAYKKESFDMFEGMMPRFQEDTVRHLFRMQIVGPDGQPITRPLQQAPQQPAMQQAPPAPTLPRPAAQPVAEGNGHGGQPVAAATACAEPCAAADMATDAGRGCTYHRRPHRRTGDPHDDR